MQSLQARHLSVTLETDMKPFFILFVCLCLLASCTNNATITGANNNDTVELKDEFGRDAYPEIRLDSAKLADSARRVQQPK